MIGTLTADDLEVVKDLRRDLHAHHATLPTPPGYRVRPFEPAWAAWCEGVAEALRARHGVVFVHRTEDQQVPDGMAYLHLLDPAALTRPILEPTGPHAELSTLVVADTARGGGIGGALADAGEAWARGHGAVALHVAVRASNVDARRLYLRRGAEPTFDGLVQPL